MISIGCSGHVFSSRGASYDLTFPDFLGRFTHMPPRGRIAADTLRFPLAVASKYRHRSSNRVGLWVLAPCLRLDNVYYRYAKKPDHEYQA
ncbi:hypothetical protein P3T24_005063 [Paraburkholderia sp. GAS33]|jgi:hypothetical protein